MESFPLDGEADDGFNDGVVAAAIELALREVVVREVVDKAVTFLRGAGVVLVPVGGKEEPLGAGVFGRTVVGRGGRRGVDGDVEVDGSAEGSEGLDGFDAILD